MKVNKAAEARRRKRAGFPFSIGDRVRVVANAPFRSISGSTRRLSPLAGQKSEVKAVNESDGEVLLDFGWVNVDDIRHADEPLTADERKVVEDDLNEDEEWVDQEYYGSWTEEDEWIDDDPILE